MAWAMLTEPRSSVDMGAVGRSFCSGLRSGSPVKSGVTTALRSPADRVILALRSPGARSTQTQSFHRRYVPASPTPGRHPSSAPVPPRWSTLPVHADAPPVALPARRYTARTASVRTNRTGKAQTVRFTRRIGVPSDHANLFTTSLSDHFHAHGTHGTVSRLCFNSGEVRERPHVGGSLGTLRP